MRLVPTVLTLAVLFSGPAAWAQQQPNPNQPTTPVDPNLPPVTPPGGGPGGMPGGMPGGGGVTNPTATGVCEVRGQMLAPSDFGIQAGLPLADMSAVRLADGRVRLYMFGQGRGVVSAVSTAPDGLSFIPEAGARLGDGSGMPRAVVTRDGNTRLFFISGDGIKSALSTDGLNFTVEPGFRITKEQAGFIDTVGGTGFEATSGASVVSLPDGRYRMYFSDLPRPGTTPGGHRVKSAVSTDMLTWTMEEGVLMGTGAATMTATAEHPFALPNPDGSVTLYYGKFSGPGLGAAEGLYFSTAADGLTFTTETLGVFFGNDPDALRLVDGTLMVYYGLFDSAIGGTINAAVCPDPTAPAAVTTPTLPEAPVDQPAPVPADPPVAAPAGRIRPILAP